MNQTIRSTSQTFDRAIWIAAAVVCLAAAVAVFGFGLALDLPSVFIGALFAVANFAILKKTTEKVLEGSDREKIKWSLLLVGKTIALVAMVGILLLQKWVSGIGFSLGLSTLVLGVLGGAAWSALKAADNTPHSTAMTSAGTTSAQESSS